MQCTSAELAHADAICRSPILLLRGVDRWARWRGRSPRAQQVTGMRRVAFLHPYAENDAEVLARIVAFRDGLEALGWTENRNIRIENQYSGGDLGRIRAYAAELVHSAPQLIVGSGTPITAALKEATSTIPIVFNLVNDPVGQGFVASLSRPGGNVTGFTFIDFPLIGKWLEMIKEIVPGVRHVDVILLRCMNPEVALRDILRRHTRSVVGRAKPIALASKMRRAGV